MPSHIYKHVELTGSSLLGMEQAINDALAKASESIHNMRWFEVIDTRGHIEDGKAAHWQCHY
jgi:flavin-binding protein dodecin